MVPSDKKLNFTFSQSVHFFTDFDESLRNNWPLLRMCIKTITCYRLHRHLQINLNLCTIMVYGEISIDHSMKYCFDIKMEIIHEDLIKKL